ncbi:MAG: hypothetical protein HY754_09030 [Nitrospirae bacterium]|nr:hypothetical protein [Nitrospirota bacterium]
MVHPVVAYFWIATVFYGLAAIFHILAFLQKKERLADLGMKLVWIGVFVHTLNFFWPAIRHNYTGI